MQQVRLQKRGHLAAKEEARALQEASDWSRKGERALWGAVGGDQLFWREKEGVDPSELNWIGFHIVSDSSMGGKPTRVRKRAP